MLQPLLELKPEVLCDTVHGALTHVLQQLLVTGHAAVDLVGRSADRPTTDTRAVFDRVRSVLVQSHFLDADAPTSETRAGIPKVRVPNPYSRSLHLPVRLQIDAQSDAAAVLLHTFLVLRVRFQTTVGVNPTMRLETSAANDFGLDLLYLAADCFTERYPVTAAIARSDEKIMLTLTGEPMLVVGGLTWARDDYVRCRDASLLIRPLREALEGVARPLAIPREVRDSLRVVRVRVPGQARERTKSLRWLSTIHELEHPAGGDVAETAGPLGDHLSVEPATGGYVAAGGEAGTDVILSVRSLAPTAAKEIILPEGSNGSIAVAFEAIGGAREIGANSYYYAFGHRGLLVDAGYDATRDGWLGLPAFERLPRLDAIVLTHAHLDHVGAVPTLLAAFPNVPVYCTRATLAVLLPQLMDSANVSEIRFSQTGEAPAISRGLAGAIRVEQFRLFDYGVRFAIPEIPGLTVEFSDAGHVIGSASASLDFSGLSILHTGDISVEDQLLLRGMRVAGITANHVVMEGTYCRDVEFKRSDRRAAVGQFLTALAERTDAGGSVLLPAFSLGKAQELVALLVKWNQQRERSVPIWAVGMVNRINEVSAAHASFLPGLVGKPFALAKPFPSPPRDDDDRRGSFARAFFELAEQGACAVIASHGMMAEETGSYLIGRAILAGEDQRHAILLTGYMDPRSPGFRLRHQRNEAVIDFGQGDAITRRLPSENIQFHRLTSHASYEELVEVATSIPERSVTFIHGDGPGLDELIGNLRGQLDAAGRNIVLRAPAIGERVLIDRVQPPDNWDVEIDGPREASTSLGPGRKFHRGTGLSVRGLTADQKWALIRVGRASVTLALESDRIDPSRIGRVELRFNRGTAKVVFDRERADGDLSRIVLTEPGEVSVRVTAHDPSGQAVDANLPVLCGAEIRAVRTALEAARPVLELEIGGTSTPELLEVTAERNRWSVDHEDAFWEPTSRILRIRLKSSSAIGTIDDVELRVRWPNGFIQSGPSIGGFTLDPCVDFEPGPARVGTPSRVRVRSSPPPFSARVGDQICVMNGEGADFFPMKPGMTAVELQYATLDGEREWREVGSVDVQPAATMDLPTGTDASKCLDVTVREVEPSLHGAELALSIGGEIRDRWTATGAPHVWSGEIPETDPLEVAALLPGAGLTLCAGSVRVYRAFEFVAKKSLPVTTADGAFDAELAFVGPHGWNRRVVEDALSAAGFVLRGWVDGLLRVAGSDQTIGDRVVPIIDGMRQVDVRIVTLSDLNLSLEPSGPINPGDGRTVKTSRGEVTVGLEEIDGGPLIVQAERVDPLFDELSARVVGNRVHFLHPGRYIVSLITRGRRLANVETTVTAPPRPNIPSAPARVERTAGSPYDVSAAAADLPPCRSTVILSAPREPYLIIQDRLSETEELVWRFITDRLTAKENVLVSWPGLALGELGGKLLRRVRRDDPRIPVAHLSFPAPRGEIASDEKHARTLRAHRVLCCARASTTIDRLDAYRCTNCEGSARLKTDSSRIWQECSNCGHADHDLVLSLTGLRSTDVRVLFADYRIAKYLSRGRGRRYAGAFGRSVRCGNCHGIQIAYASTAPWDRAELRGLLAAIASTWNSGNPTSSIHSAAYLAARRTHRSRPNDVLRLEDALRRLLDADVVQDGRVGNPLQLEKLDAGLSLCCGHSVVWSNRRAACVFLDVEELFSPDVPASSHPDLPFGRAGVRQILTLSE
jgi:Cft2 family RNA processing exonuclease